MKLAIYSNYVWNINSISEFLSEYELVYRDRKAAEGFLGWGFKLYSNILRRYARFRKLPFICAEDGFIRSYNLGVSGTPPLGMVVDDIGIYYNASSPSKLEKLIEQDFSPEKLERARKNVELIKKHQLSKYNVFSDAEFKPSEKSVLVIDQCAADASIKYGMADDKSFEQMVSDAIFENPDSEIIVKVHPDVIAGKRKGRINLKKYKNRITVLSENINPHLIFQRVQKVYVATSLLGFEALFYNLPVKCYGMPFYGGWGLTEDKIKCNRRTKKAKLEEVFHAAYIDYARYVNPNTGKRCELEDVIEIIAALKLHYAKHP